MTADYVLALKGNQETVHEEIQVPGNLEPYFLNCGPDTMTQAEIEAGTVNIVVGFAPLQPAEFVILRIQQLAGQSSG